MRYDAFISYSHFLDHNFAPAIQTALQRLGKPWYKLRQLNVFRDETDLSASPALWEKIEEALKSSAYFILLASPEAVNSKWITKEIEYWIANKDISKFIIVLTSGSIYWKENDFDWEKTTAIGKNMIGKFKSEPLYIDFTKIRSNIDLSINNPLFKLNIARISAPIQSITVKELIDQDVQEHRKTLRTRNTVIIVLAVFVVSLIVTSLLIFNQRNTARRNAKANDHVVKALNRISTTQSLSHIYEAYKLNPSPYISNLLNSFQGNPATFYNWIDIKDSMRTERAAYYDNEFVVGYAWGAIRTYSMKGEKIAERKLVFQGPEDIIPIEGTDRMITWGYDTSIDAQRVYILSKSSLKNIKDFYVRSNITSASITPEKNILLTDFDGMIRIIDTAGNFIDSIHLDHNGGHIHKAFQNRDGNFIALIYETSGNSGSIKKFSKKGKLIGLYTTLQNTQITHIDYHSGKKLLAGVGVNGSSFLWDTTGLAKVQHNTVEEGLVSYNNWYNINDCRFSNSGDRFAIIVNDNCIIRGLDGKVKGNASILTGSIDRIMFTGKEEQFFTFGIGEARIFFWDNRGFMLEQKEYEENAEIIRSKQGDLYAVQEQDSAAIYNLSDQKLCFKIAVAYKMKYFDNYADELFVLAGDSCLQLVQKNNDQYLSRYINTDPDYTISFLCFDHYNNHVYYASLGRTMVRYNINTGKNEGITFDMQGEAGFVYPINKNELLIGGGKLSDSAFLGVYTPGLKLIRKLVGHTDEVTDAAIIQNGELIISVDDAGKMILWEKNSGKQRFSVQAGIGVSMNVDVSGDGKYFITNGMIANEVCIIDRLGNKIQAQIYPKEPVYVKFTKDGNYLVLARNRLFKMMSLDNFMRSGRIATTEQIKILEKGIGIFSFNSKALIQ